VEITYDAPYRTAGGLVKNSYLLYDDEMANVLSISRYIGALSEAEAARRRRQVARRFDPPWYRRALRWLRNMFNTVRDAGSKALSAIVGQFARARPGTVVSQSTGEVNQIGQTIITSVGYAYEPMLERHIGDPVVLEMTSPTDPTKRSVELAGYLAEYSDRYVAIFNVDQPMVERFELSGEAGLDRDDLRIEADDLAVTVTNRDDLPLVVESIGSASGERRALSVVLNQGAIARLPRFGAGMTLALCRVRRVDVICPRQYARVRHASGDEVEPQGEPVSLPPAHEDQRVEFP
jgi:hypothetical protein